MTWTEKSFTEATAYPAVISHSSAAQAQLRSHTSSTDGDEQETDPQPVRTQQESSRRAALTSRPQRHRSCRTWKLHDSLEVTDCPPIIVCGDANESLLCNTREPMRARLRAQGGSHLITAASTARDPLLGLTASQIGTLFPHHSPKAHHVLSQVMKSWLHRRRKGTEIKITPPKNSLHMSRDD